MCNKDFGEMNVISQLDIDRKIKHYTQTITANIHHFYLYGLIDDDITMYSDLLNILKTSSEHDTIVIHINSEGGVLRMALQIANAMLATEAKVITSLDGEAISAATFIFLAGDEYIINPNCSFMIHNYSGRIGGKGHEILSQVTHTGSTVSKMMRFFYEKILSEQELEDVCKGSDLWMDSDELMSRLATIEEEEVVEEVKENLEKPLEKEKVYKKKKVKKKTSKKVDKTKD